MVYVFPNELPYKDILSKATQLALIGEYRKSNDEAIKQDIFLKLLGSNWKLIYHIAKSYKIDKDVAMNVGCIGLMKAIQKIDLSLDNSLSTVAWWWIKLEIHRAAHRELYTVPVPEYISVLMSKKIREAKITKSSSDFVGLFGDEYSHKELRMYYAYIQKVIITPSNYQSEDDQPTDYYELADERKDFEKVDIALYITKLIDIIKDNRTRELVVKYYGVCGEVERTLEILGKEYGLTKERVRQVINAGIEVIRNYVKKNKNKYI